MLPSNPVTVLCICAVMNDCAAYSQMPVNVLPCLQAGAVVESKRNNLGLDVIGVVQTSNYQSELAFLDGGQHKQQPPHTTPLQGDSAADVSFGSPVILGDAISAYLSGALQQATPHWRRHLAVLHFHNSVPHL